MEVNPNYAMTTDFSTESSFDSLMNTDKQFLTALGLTDGPIADALKNEKVLVAIKEVAAEAGVIELGSNEGMLLFDTAQQGQARCCSALLQEARG